MEGREDVVGELLVALLRARREVARHVELAERVAQVVLLLIEHPFPARALLRRAVQDRAVEVEVLGVEAAAGLRRVGVGQMPAQVGLPVAQGSLREGLVDLLVELGLPHDHAGEVVEVTGFEEALPGDRRRERRKTVDRHGVIVRARIAQVLELARGARQLGLMEGHVDTMGFSYQNRCDRAA